MIANWGSYSSDELPTLEEIAIAPEIGSAVGLEYLPNFRIYHIVFKPLDINGEVKDGEQWTEVSGRSGTETVAQSKQEAKMFVEGILYQATR